MIKKFTLLILVFCSFSFADDFKLYTYYVDSGSTDMDWDDSCKQKIFISATGATSINNTNTSPSDCPINSKSYEYYYCGTSVCFFASDDEFSNFLSDNDKPFRLDSDGNFYTKNSDGLFLNGDNLYNPDTGDVFSYNPDTNLYQNDTGATYNPDTGVYNYPPPSNVGGTGDTSTPDNTCPTPPTCGVNESVLHCECVCDAGYAPNSNGVCEPTCVIPTLTTPTGWTPYVNIYNSDNECFVKAQTTQSGNYNFKLIDNSVGFQICRFAICEVDERTNNNCINRNDLIVPTGFIFKGIVNTSLECEVLVNGVDYLYSSTQNVYDNCYTDFRKYCYLKPSLDNNDTGITPPSSEEDINNIPNLTPPNLTSPSESDNIANNQELKIQTQILRNIDNSLKNNQDNSLRDRLLTNISASNNDLNLKLTNLSNINSNGFNDLKSNLNTLIGDTTDTSGQALSDAMGTLTNLSDINTSLPSFTDDENTTTYQDITDTALSAFDNFETDSQTALTDMIGSIDYGISDMFNVGSYDFVDYPISVTLPMSTTKLEGNLMSASFLNSLDFSLGRLALLLATLVFSVYYVINRLFS